MKVRFALPYTIIGLAFLAPWGGHGAGIIRWILGLGCLTLALLYAAGEDPDRRVGTWVRRPDWVGSLLWLWLAPFRLIAWLFVRFRPGLIRENAFDEILPGLWLGRRPMSFDRPQLESLGITALVDFCAEFNCSGAGTGLTDVLPLPVLDGGPPCVDDLAAAVRWVDERLERGTKVLVHCAAGHGRSATLVACVVASRGLATDEAAAEAFVKQRRPGIRLNQLQARQVRLFLERTVAGQR